MAYGRTWDDVFNQFWYQTLIDLTSLEEVERIAELRQRARDIERAYLQHYAQHKPSELTNENDKLIAELNFDEFAGPEQEFTREELLRAAIAMGQQLHKLVP